MVLLAIQGVGDRPSNPLEVPWVVLPASLVVDHHIRLGVQVDLPCRPWGVAFPQEGAWVDWDVGLMGEEQEVMEHRWRK